MYISKSFLSISASSFWVGIDALWLGSNKVNDLDLKNIMQKLISFTKDILAESCYMLLVANMNIEHSVTSFP